MSFKREGIDAAKKLYYIKKDTRWSGGAIGSQLPEAYKKFWQEWKNTTPSPVHWIPKPGKYEFHPEYKTCNEIQNVPLPLKYPKQIHEGIWGGEAVVQGFQKKGRWRARVPHFWRPNLKKSVLYSEVLNEYMEIVVTERTIELIHENYGFDHYLLKTKACDLYSELALKLKRKILQALFNKTLYPDDPVERDRIYETYKHYLDQYTPEEIEWYGYSFPDAVKKYCIAKANAVTVVPLKIQLRSQLIEKLKTEREENKRKQEAEEIEKTRTWLSKINPFKGDSQNA